MNNVELWSADKFYRRLEYLLKERRWSLHRLSIKTDTSAASLYEMRRKNFLPRFKTLCMICDALDISLHEFFFTDTNLTDESYHILSGIADLSEESQKVLISLIKLLPKNS